jgi:hypothetical protein
VVVVELEEIRVLEQVVVEVRVLLLLKVLLQQRDMYRQHQEQIQ